MSAPSQVVFGRDPTCDVVVDDGSISSRHARLLAVQGGFVVEDLGSTNGTFVAGERVQHAAVRPGDDVRLGAIALPWGHPKVTRFVRARIGRGTMVLPGVKPGAGRARGAALFVLAAGVVLGGAGFALVRLSGRAPALAAGAPAAQDPSAPSAPDVVDDVPHIGRTRADAIAAAMDPAAPTTRNTAVKIAAESDGPFHVEQVARIWTFVRGRWNYVNDPVGREYFAKASETITNEYAGDCDDFAIVLASMIQSIGGEARVVVMRTAEGGHAYAEACVRMPAEDAAARLSTYYRRKWDPYLGRQRVTRIHYRASETCPLWLNLDWSAGVPGGPYVDETWAVAVSPDGKAEVVRPGRSDASAPDAGTPLAPAPRPRR